MKEILKPSKTEQPTMIAIGIIAFYALILGFVCYLFFLHRISLTSAIISTIILTLIYIPRFLILNKLSNKDKIEITDNCIIINGNVLEFKNIADFRITRKKPKVVFFMNNKMVVFQEAQIDLKLKSSTFSFCAIGTEKIDLLEEFLTKLLEK